VDNIWHTRKQTARKDNKEEKEKGFIKALANAKQRERNSNRN
jgi:hypothetical protein